jgi:bacterioferritin (cytochrome b1)
VLRVSSSTPYLSVQASVEELQGAEETERRAKDRAVKEAAAEAAAEKRKATQARVERMKEWDEEEIRMLEKALEKFPQVGLSRIMAP